MHSPLKASPTLAALTPALAGSPYLQRLLDARADLAAAVARQLEAPLTAATMTGMLAGEALDEASLKPALRRLRTFVFACVAARDLGGAADLAEVTEAMSLLAETTLNTALNTIEAELCTRYGEPRNGSGLRQRLIVVGMGKLGGRELNVSSDIDLIFVYPEDGQTSGPQVLSNFEYFIRLGRRLIEALAEPTGDGQVFRVDMRLRPNGDSGPLVVSFDMLENYFISQGREWERYAWIKARPITGERWDELEALSKPFVFRKYLDYGAVNAMRELHAQIRAEVQRREMADNVKLGPGGIREIEFIAQVFQLIRGGRDTGLRIRPTLRVLRELGRRGTLPGETVEELSAAYVFLRRLEHRLQYVEDQQTHRLPQGADERARIARAMEFADEQAMMQALDEHRLKVSRHFDEVFAIPASDAHALEPVWRDADGAPDRADELARLGYRDATAACQRLAAIRSGGRYRQLSAAMRERFDQLVPRLIEAATKTPEPDATLTRGLDLLEAISRRGAYLALLNQYPQALSKVAQLVGASSWAAEYLTRHPVLLDELLDTRLLEAAPDWPTFASQLAAELEALEPDMERQMDIMREDHHAQVFRLLAQDLAGRLTVERLADHLSQLADIMLAETLRRVWHKIRQRHRDTPRFAVVSYGKLGGKELGYASDLDIIFLFDDESDAAPENYARLAQRMNSWLSSRTSAGILFETDLRLRPNGDAGLLVSSVAAFRKYQMESAWVWEHQALTRARFSAGDAALGEQFEAIRIEVLRKRRDLAELAREVLAMRERMRAAHGGKSELFDLKHDSGGLIDVEFMVQYLVLGYAADHASLTANVGNIALLRIAGELGLIAPDLASRVADAYREYRHLQHRLRLNSAGPARVDRASVARRIEDVETLWRRVFDQAG